MGARCNLSGFGYFREASTPRPPSPFHGEGGDFLLYIAINTMLFPSPWNGRGGEAAGRRGEASPGGLAMAVGTPLPPSKSKQIS